MKLNLDEVLTSLAQARQDDVDEQVANALFRVGTAYLQHHRPDLAKEALDEALYLCNKLENPGGRAQVDLKMAEAEQAQGELAQAERRLMEAMVTFKELDDKAGLVNALEHLGRLYETAGQAEPACRVYGDALLLARGSGDNVSELLLAQRRAPLLRALGRADEALVEYRGMAAAASEVQDPQRLALALVGVGTLSFEQGMADVGAKALGDAADTYAILGQTKRAEQVRRELERFQEDNPKSDK